MHRSILLLLCFSCIVAFGTTSCLFVKAPEQKGRTGDDADLSPLPEIEMGDELVRSQAGDLIALLPNGWLFLDTKNDVSDDIIAVAVNPEYTMSAVFSVIPSGATITDAYSTEGLLGLARVAFSKHARKTAGTVSLVGTYAISDLGTRSFGTYAFSGSSASVTSRCAVFTSTLGNFYEFALVPLTVSGRDLPADREQEAVFNSILATIQY